MGDFCAWCRWKFIDLVQTSQGFSKQYNVLLLDLRGHGNSKTSKNSVQTKYLFRLLMIFWRFRFSKLKITFCGISLNFNSNQTIS
jgi:pimeloyl-ACP methyl ester carboxylesterase